MRLPLYIMVKKLDKAFKYYPNRIPVLARQLVQNYNHSKLTALLASQPILWAVIAPLILHTQNTQAGEPVFAPPVIKPFGLDFPVSYYSYGTGFWSSEFVDIDNDGDQDIIGKSFYNGYLYNQYSQITFIKNSGTNSNPKFSSDTISNPFGLNLDSIRKGEHYDGYGILSFKFSDIDSDGDNDMFLIKGAYKHPVYITFYENKGIPSSPNFAQPIIRPFGLGFLSGYTYGSPYLLDIVDYDKDSDLDIIVYNQFSNEVSNYNDLPDKVSFEFYKNIGNKTDPHFEIDSAYSGINSPKFKISNDFHPTAFKVTDYDLDGDLEGVVLGIEYNSKDNCRIFNNKDSSSLPFSSMKTATIPSLKSYTTCFTDIDADGDLDIVGYSKYKPLNFYDYLSNFIFLENLGHSNNSVQGIVYMDSNENGIKDSSEMVMPNIVINYEEESNPINLFSITDTAGNFLFPALDGSYVVKPTVPKYHTSVPAQATINTADTNFYYTQNFAIQPINTTTSDLVGYITSGPARPGFKVPFWLTYKNVGTKAMTGSMLYTKDNRLSFVTASTAPNSQSGNNLTWNFSNLQPLESVTIYAEMQLSAAATLGDTLKNIVQITPLSGDLTPQDNSDTLHTIIVGSFDPNDKLVTPSGTGTEGHISPSTGLFEYTVRFQNTGTDTAFNIVVKDSLGTNFDWSTLQILSSSHPVTSVVRNTSTLKFTFDNILLPASIQNEPKSHGFVKYSIQPKASQPVGSRFTNNANIFFDYNSPVLTNTTVNTFFVATALVGKQNQTFELFPNPMNERAILRFDNIYGEEFQFTLYSLNGNIVESRSVSGGSLEIERKSLALGIYVFKLEGAQTMGTGMIVVQ